MDWHVHWLEAEGDLALWRDTISAELQAACHAIGRLIAPSPMDVLVQRQTGAVIPETGTLGFAYRPRLFSITIDPDNPNFANALARGDIRRTAAHEAHHCLRMAGPGYGTTLGEALVSEGLAGQFVCRLFGSVPEPWECAVDDDTLRENLPSASMLNEETYDHGAWFFGTGTMPRWLGYTLGFRLVGDWLSTQAPIDDALWVNAPASEVLAIVKHRSLGKRAH